MFHHGMMKKQFIIGAIGGFLGILTAVWVLSSSHSPDMTLSGLQAALFSSLGLMGSAIANSETRFAGWMLLSSAVWIPLSVPLSGSLNLLVLYIPAVLFLGASSILCFTEPGDEEMIPSREELM